MIRPRPRDFAMLWVASLCVGCRTDADAGSLAGRPVDAKAAAAVAPGPAPAPAPAATASEPPTPEAPAPAGERVDLWLDLDPAKTVRVLTVGMLELPLVNRPAGFAREETLTFRDCVGEGAARTCVVEHALGRFEAEPPTGKILEQDEKRFADVRSHHRVDARGLKVGDATIIGPAGPPDFADTDLGRALVAVHRYGCIRLPTEPVAVGAKWSDTCHFVFGGQVSRVDAAWELTALSDDPVSGKRAELTMLGKLAVPSAGGERAGTIEGKLYFFVDAHAPHILRMRARVPLKPGQSMESTTTLNLQFGLVDATGVVTRTDGAPLQPAAPVPAAGPETPSQTQPAPPPAGGPSAPATPPARGR